MRLSDIANLNFDNIKMEKEEIAFIQQKTRLEICIPLRPVLGNAIYDYIVNERPKCNSDNIFITAVTPFIKLSLSGISNDSVRIYKEAGIRQEKSQRKFQLS
jgi:integrase